MVVVNQERSLSLNLVIENISKQYNKNVWGLKNFKLELGPGILGLVGPNGAGKSTLMRILETITRPSEGRVTWNGTDIVNSPKELRKVLGYLPQDFGVYPNLNAIEFLEYMAAIKGLDARTTRRRIQKLLSLVNLTEASKRPLGGYSGGMKQRIGIAQALLNDPQLLIVDEPTVGLDPEERVRFRNLFSDLSGDRIVILSTHIVSDVEAIATSIATIHEGHLITHTKPEGLIKNVEGKVWNWTVPNSALPTVREEYLISSTIRRTNGINVRIVAEQSPNREAKNVAPTLEDAYLYCIDQSRSGALT